MLIYLNFVIVTILPWLINSWIKCFALTSSWEEMGHGRFREKKYRSAHSLSDVQYLAHTTDLPYIPMLVSLRFLGLTQGFAQNGFLNYQENWSQTMKFKDSFKLSFLAILSCPYITWAVLALNFYTDKLSHLLLFKYVFKNNTVFYKNLD